MQRIKKLFRDRRLKAEKDYGKRRSKVHGEQNTNKSERRKAKQRLKNAKENIS